MADATYDAVIVGAGTKALVTAMYLTKYGRMDVALFEERVEAGGGWGGEDTPAPGFIHNVHSTDHTAWHIGPVYDDFPDFEEKGAKYIQPKATGACIFREDQRCLIFYGDKYDPEGELTAKSIAQFSERDAAIYKQVVDAFNGIWRPIIYEWFFTVAPPPGELDILERTLHNPAVGIDPLWLEMSPLQVIEELFESPEMKAAILRQMESFPTVHPDMPGGWLGVWGLIAAVGWYGLNFAVGSSHSTAHAAVRVILENGGKIFTKNKVDKILIENGKARGIRLTNGTEIEARKLVVSTLNPYQLCFNLIGREHLSANILNRVSNLRSNLITVTWYGWAIHEPPRYTAAKFNPDINEVQWTTLCDRDYKKQVRFWHMRSAGIMPPDPYLATWCHSRFDPTQAPQGKQTAAHEAYVLNATALTEREWLKFKKEHAEYAIKTWQEYAPNMTWDNVIGYDPITPYDIAKRLSNMGPEGNWGVIDHLASQVGKNRPIPELAQHRTPIKNLYATGSAWPPFGMATTNQGYTCYKVIAEDFGLRKPWEEKNRPY